MKELAWLIAGGVVIYLYEQSKAAGNLTFFPGNITGIGNEGITPVVKADLIIQNPSNVDFTVSAVAANVYDNGYLVGNISNFNTVGIPHTSQITYPINIRLQLIGIANDLINALTGGGGGSHTLTVDGTVNGNGVQLPLKLEYKIGA